MALQDGPIVNTTSTVTNHNKSETEPQLLDLVSYHPTSGRVITKQDFEQPFDNTNSH